MQYFFILGNNPTLSLAELSAVFSFEARVRAICELSLLENVFILKTDQAFKADELIKKLGGTIKIGIIKSMIEQGNNKKILDEIKKILPSYHKGKFQFGISYYGKKKFNTKGLAMDIKKFLLKQNISSRWVTSREPTLSSVVVEQNKLITKGIDIVLIENNKKLLIGQTLAVQPFKELSFRDYGRPARDDYSGMLPPKLAQIMINLSQAKQSDIILDPFCGSGTILTEAMFMGYKNLIGADVSAKAVSDTNKNIAWIKEKFRISDFGFQIYKKNVFDLSRIIKLNSVDTIVTEPYLGPQRGKFSIAQTIEGLEELYLKSLVEFRKVLKKNGRVVMIWPVFVLPRGTTGSKLTLKYVTPDLNGLKIINPIPEKLRRNKIVKLTKRITIIYGRPWQRVWREIVVLTQI